MVFYKKGLPDGSWRWLRAACEAAFGRPCVRLGRGQPATNAVFSKTVKIRILKGRERAPGGIGRSKSGCQVRVPQVIRASEPFDSLYLLHGLCRERGAPTGACRAAA